MWKKKKKGAHSMRIAIFGGSFDPVHNEHIRVAEEAIRSLRLDKLIVMPAHTPPHKSWERLADDTVRLYCCRLAFAHLENVEVSDYEINKGGTSYTFETCRYFRKEYPSAELFWLVGTDMLYDFPTWKNPEDILQNVTLAVCARDEKQGWLDRAQADFEQRFSKRFAVVEYNGAPVSSTEIRVLAGAGMRLDGYVPDSVATYMENRKVYAIPFAKDALALQKLSRREHSLGVAKLAAKRARGLKIDESKAITAGLFHDCAKNLELDSPLLSGFVKKDEWGDIPQPVLHQFTGAYLAETRFGVTDTDVLNAVRYHTSGRENMSDLEKLIFLADMLEEGRNFDGVDELRALFWEKDLDVCLKVALKRSLGIVESKGGTVYPLTRKAYEFYR
ncbi:MAG: nicotinate (nicotinamide) nucleotide adenylyltransferase [Clostridia bacterium]|nr:nicotinate (nicotinamide) nucleotide adenylyltransferase [Clostridia bacterium]